MNTNKSDVLNVEQLTETQALELVYDMYRKFDWALCLYTREDVKTALQEHRQDYDTEPTDEEIQKVMDTRMWRKYMEEALGSTGWECLQDAIYDAENDEEM